ncbi:hypothetical protein Acr_16g0005700 [Actinidia rufa]|uniref:Uncharacterized protein n=1 Tax=Actinidia rufa TaxID=165716 RepID=A0A7J0FZ40_9ERIC|nr:hypothetical protein Acr_16g0005700 [Actinidia rufa]
MSLMGRASGKVLDRYRGDNVLEAEAGHSFLYFQWPRGIGKGGTRYRLLGWVGWCLFFCKVRLRKRGQDRDLAHLEDHCTLLYQQLSVRAGVDHLAWTVSWSGKLVQGKVFGGAALGERGGPFCRKGICAVDAPSKDAFFVWNAAPKKILMIDNLIKRQRVYATGGVYANMMVKMVKYLFIHCRVVRDMWGTVVNYLLTNVAWHGSVPTRQFQLDNIMLQEKPIRLGRGFIASGNGG